MAAAQLVARVARQPEAQQRIFVPFLITVGLVEAALFINVAFMALFVFATPGASKLDTSPTAAARTKDVKIHEPTEPAVDQRRPPARTSSVRIHDQNHASESGDFNR